MRTTGAARAAAVAVGLLAGAAAVGALQENLWPGRHDQGAYLNLGVIARYGGFPWDEVRGPLVPWLVMGWSDRGEAYFVAAKALSAAAAALTVGGAAVLGARLAGGAGGLAAALALSAQGAFWRTGCRAAAEGVLSLLFAAAALFAARGRWAAAGAALGLGHIAKSSAMLALPGLLFAAWRDRGARAAAAAAGAFLVAASPLLLHAAATRGDPFYSEASRHVLWMEAWGEDWDAPPPTWRTYAERRSLADAAARLVAGLEAVGRGEALLLLAALAGAAALGPGRARPIEARRLAALLYPTLAAFLLLFAWYPVKDARFLLPLRAPAWALAALALGGLGSEGGRRAAATVGALALLAAAAAWPAARPVGALHDDLRALLDWRAASGVRWDEVAADAHDDVLPGAWLEPTPGLRPMTARPLDDGDASARCLVVTRHALLARREAFSPWIDFGPTAEGAPVVVQSTPPGWAAPVSRPSVAVLCRRPR